MQLTHDSLSIQDTIAVQENTRAILLDKSCLDYKVGDRFFVRKDVDHIHTVVDLKSEKGYTIVSSTGQEYAYDDIFPIFSVGMLIELLSDFNDFQLQNFGHGWLLLWNGHILKQSTEEEALVHFLWRSLCEIIEADEFVW